MDALPTASSNTSYMSKPLTPGGPPASSSGPNTLTHASNPLPKSLTPPLPRSVSQHPINPSKSYIGLSARSDTKGRSSTREVSSQNQDVVTKINPLFNKTLTFQRLTEEREQKFRTLHPATNDLTEHQHKMIKFSQANLQTSTEQLKKEIRPIRSYAFSYDEKISMATSVFRDLLGDDSDITTDVQQNKRINKFFIRLPMLLSDYLKSMDNRLLDELQTYSHIDAYYHLLLNYIMSIIEEKDPQDKYKKEYLALHINILGQIEWIYPTLNNSDHVLNPTVYHLLIALLHIIHKKGVHEFKVVLHQSYVEKKKVLFLTTKETKDQSIPQMRNLTEVIEKLQENNHFKAVRTQDNFLQEAVSRLYLKMVIFPVIRDFQVMSNFIKKNRKNINGLLYLLKQHQSIFIMSSLETLTQIRMSKEKSSDDSSSQHSSFIAPKNAFWTLDKTDIPGLVSKLSMQEVKVFLNKLHIAYEGVDPQNLPKMLTNFLLSPESVFDTDEHNITPYKMLFQQIEATTARFEKALENYVLEGNILDITKGQFYIAQYFIKFTSAIQRYKSNVFDYLLRFCTRSIRVIHSKSDPEVTKTTLTNLSTIFKKELVSTVDTTTTKKEVSWELLPSWLEFAIKCKETHIKKKIILFHLFPLLLNKKPETQVDLNDTVKMDELKKTCETVDEILPVKLVESVLQTYQNLEKKKEEYFDTLNKLLKYQQKAIQSYKHKTEAESKKALKDLKNSLELDVLFSNCSRSEKKLWIQSIISSPDFLLIRAGKHHILPADKYLRGVSNLIVDAVSLLYENKDTLTNPLTIEQLIILKKAFAFVDKSLVGVLEYLDLRSKNIKKPSNDSDKTLVMLELH
jgi:hypothetical protein